MFLHSLTPHLNLFPHPLFRAVIASGKQKQLQLMKIRQVDARRRPEGKYRRRPPLLKRYTGDVLAPVISIQFHTCRINMFLSMEQFILSNTAVHKQIWSIYKLQSHPHIYQSPAKMYLNLAHITNTNPNLFCNYGLRLTCSQKSVGKLPEHTMGFDWGSGVWLKEHTFL